jgi:hypothetical protein
MRKRTLLLWVLLAAGVALGAARDFVFVNLNYQLDFLHNHRPVSYAHSLFRGWVEGWDLTDLLRLKWAMAALFIAAMGALGVAFARVLFGDHRHRRTILLGYALVAALALAGHLAARSVPALAPLSIQLLHLLQYPVVLVFLWAGGLMEYIHHRGTEGTEKNGKP